SRHPLLDVGFRVVAVFALMAWGFSSQSKIMFYLGIPMLIGIPAAYRMARTARALRERGVPPGSPDAHTIPPETAVAIIDELQKTSMKGRTSKMVAQQVLQIFETLNARPPGAFATIGLLFTYFVSVGMALVFAGVLLVGSRGDWRGVLTG